LFSRHVLLTLNKEDNLPFAYPQTDGCSVFDHAEHGLAQAVGELPCGN
jgi:hypothetical protein